MSEKDVVDSGIITALLIELDETWLGESKRYI